MKAAVSDRPAVETGSPEWRAALFAQAVAYAAHLSGPISPHALHKHLRSFLGQAEEVCGSEAHDAVIMLVATGLFTTDTEDEDGLITFRNETMLTVSPELTAYVYGEIGQL